MKHGICYGLVSALLALILLIPANMALAQDSDVLVANPSEISVTLYEGEKTTKTVTLYNNGTESISGHLYTIHIYCADAPYVHIVEYWNFSIPPGENKKIHIQIFAAEDAKEFPEENFPVFLTNDSQEYTSSNTSTSNLFTVHVKTLPHPADYSLMAIVALAILIVVPVAIWYGIKNRKKNDSF